MMISAALERESGLIVTKMFSIMDFAADRTVLGSLGLAMKKMAARDHAVSISVSALVAVASRALIAQSCSLSVVNRVYIRSFRRNDSLGVTEIVILRIPSDLTSCATS